jgi:tetratricopeptide (TPR) repeat protein
MRIRNKKRCMRLFGAAVVCLLLAGCNSESDRTEEENPLVRRGLEQARLRNWDGAIRQFEKALAGDPELARPDLELALIYHQYEENFIRAVYHYGRYLEKRPETEKKPLILDWIRQAKISLAGEIGRTAGDISGELVRLRRENNLLRKQLEAFSGKPQPTPGVTEVKTLLNDPPPPRPPEPVVEPPQLAPPAAAESVPAPAPEIKTYTVLPGDTLTRIARQVCGDPAQWRKIYEANRGAMENENDLKAGQVIRIPPLTRQAP